MRIQRVPVGSIDPAPYNPRKDLAPGDPEYERLKRSLDEFGLVEPLVWNVRTGRLVGGHQRLKVLLERGDREVEVSVVDLPVGREKALNIALNKIQGEWDERRLAELLDEMLRDTEFDVELSGFDTTEAESLVAEVLRSGLGEHEYDVEADLASDGPVITRPGELIELGRHRLLCGDSTDPAHVRRVMDGERAVLFATDPPYLVNYDPGLRPSSPRSDRRAPKKQRSARGSTRARSSADRPGPCAWDDPGANPQLYERFIAAAVEGAITENAAWYCWHASRRQAMVEGAWEKAGAFVHQQIVWAKEHAIPGRSWYGWQHEPCFFGWRAGHKPPRRSREPTPTVWRASQRENADKRPTDHPTPKPVRLFEIPILQHTRPGEVCYEPFAGSGSQIVAAERLRRRCFAMELSPRYCDVIVRRYIALGGSAPAALADRYRREPRS